MDGRRLGIPRRPKEGTRAEIRLSVIVFFRDAASMNKVVNAREVDNYCSH